MTALLVPVVLVLLSRATAVQIGGRSPTGLGDAVPLSEEGYLRLASAQNNEEMKAFVQRVLDASGLVVTDEGMLNGLIPYYSGVANTQTLDQLTKELQDASWVASRAVVRATAPEVRLEPRVAAAQQPQFYATESHEVAGKEAAAMEAEKPAAMRREHIEASLPDVRSIMGSGGDPLTEFASQTKAMQDLVASKEAKTVEGLKAERSEFEKRLNQKRAENALDTLRNQELLKQVQFKQDRILGGRNRSLKLQQKNDRMREALQMLGPKVSVARRYISVSLNVTDDSKVLEEINSPSAPTLERLLTFAAEGRLRPSPATSAPLPAAALVLLGGRMAAASTESSENEPRNFPNPQADKILQVLARTLESVTAAEKEGRLKLKAHFLAALEVEEQKHTVIMAEQTNLNKTIAELDIRQGNIAAAHAYLLDRNKDLHERLSGLQAFAQKVKMGMNEVLRASEAAMSQIPGVNTSNVAPAAETQGAAALQEAEAIASSEGQ